MQSGSEFSYEDRYGVRPAKRWVAPAVVIAVIGISWLVWVGLHHSNPDIRFSVIPDMWIEILVLKLGLCPVEHVSWLTPERQMYSKTLVNGSFRL